MLTLQVWNPGNMEVMSLLGGGLCSLSALVVLLFFFFSLPISFATCFASIGLVTLL